MNIISSFYHFKNLALHLRASFITSGLKILILNTFDTDTFKVEFSMNLLLDGSSKIIKDLVRLKFRFFDPLQ